MLVHRFEQIISVLLLTIEDDATLIDAADRMSLHRLRDSMGVGLEPVLGYLRFVRTLIASKGRVSPRADIGAVPLRRLVYRIIEREDPNLAALVEM